MIVQVSVPSITTESRGRAGRARVRRGRATRAPGRRRRRGERAASGTSAQKTLPQAKCSSSSPPATGPAATPMPTTAPQTPSAAARSRRSGKVLLMIESVVGKISAAKAPITNAGGDQRAGVGDDGADRAGRGEADQPDDQRRPPAEAVGEAAGGQHQPGEGEVVAVDDPLQLAGAGVELVGMRRQGHVDDRGVEVDREDGGADREQDGELPFMGSSADAMWTVTTSSVGTQCDHCQHRPGRLPPVSSYHHGNLRASPARARRSSWPARQGPTASCSRGRAPGRRLAQRGLPPLRRPRALLAEIAGSAMRRLRVAMQRRATRRRRGPRRRPARAAARLRATGRAYVDFALGEPGLFDVAFSGHRPTRTALDDGHRSLRPARPRCSTSWSTAGAVSAELDAGRRGGLLVGRPRVRDAARARAAARRTRSRSARHAWT